LLLPSKAQLLGVCLTSWLLRNCWTEEKEHGLQSWAATVSSSLQNVCG
jgi:hypothetical protein